MNLIEKLRAKLNVKRWISNKNIIGPKVKIGNETVIRGSYLSGDIRIGNNCNIKQVEMFGNITIGNYTSLWGPNIDLHSKINPIIIGNFCSIGRNVNFQEFNHDYSRFTTYFINQNLLKRNATEYEVVSNGGINVEHDVWIGAQCVILSGSQICTGAIIAANSVVNGYIPPYAIVAGSPAKIIKYRFNEETIKKMLATEWWTWSGEKIKENFSYLEAICKD